MCIKATSWNQKHTQGHWQVSADESSLFQREQREMYTQSVA